MVSTSVGTAWWPARRGSRDGRRPVPAAARPRRYGGGCPTWV